MNRGHFGIGTYNGAYRKNFGCVVRSARSFGADYVVTIGNDYREGQPSAVGHDKHIPRFHYEDERIFKRHTPENTHVVLVDYDESAAPLPRFAHPERAVYLLGSEGDGFDGMDTDIADSRVYVPTNYCLNQADSGSIVLYDRMAKASSPDVATMFDFVTA